MAQVELIMPKMGESIMEATILKWLKQDGDPIGEEEAVLEIATDKVDSEVPSPVAGVLVKKLFDEGAVVPVGKAIALIETEAGATQQTPAAPVTEKNTTETPAIIAPQTAQTATVNTAATGAAADDRFYSPLVLNIARQEGISMDELAQLTGTGANNRVTKKDILQYVETRKAQPITTIAPPPPPAPEPEKQTAPAPTVTTITPPKVEYGSNVEIVEMDRMRRLIADHMVMSKSVSPHVTSFVEVDVTNMVKWRDKVKDQFQKREGDKISFTPLLIEAAVKAIKDYPMLNSSVDGYKIIIRKDINIGMATATPEGNLIVPVIKNADQKSLIGLTKTVNDLANRGKAGKLKPDEIQGGTFTFTNVGTFGSLMGTPIINQPQVAVLATGIIRKKPAVLETEYGDIIAIRHLMIMSLSYDHRIIDGALGSTFLNRVAYYLENFDTNRNF
ncbi:MAG TPA: dihydrolipoamide acetyltransferase family protein [Chitinophagales bacterium]|nr:dihydrolipoamide acetyltransferase family protein [Chitinophagales bacterium]HRK28570.1 dihydrolipoamide acetyltransferase family protein [Chitinophagales bacterium]